MIGAAEGLALMLLSWAIGAAGGYLAGRARGVEIGAASVAADVREMERPTRRGADTLRRQWKRRGRR